MTAQYSSPLVAHLKELRDRLLVSALVILVGFIVCYIYKEEVFNVLTAPLASAQGGELEMIFTSVPELFLTYLKLSLLGGVFIGFPVLLWELWRFIAPGLYKSEKRVVLPFIVVTPLLFYAGGAFTLFIVMPMITDFFLQFQTENISALPSVKNYLAFFTKLIFAFGVAFELPVLILLLARVGVVTIKKLQNFRRYAIVCIFVFAAILTPPDPASQLLLALPMILLYELSLWGVKLMNIKSNSSHKPASI